MVPASFETLGMETSENVAVASEVSSQQQTSVGWGDETVVPAEPSPAAPWDPYEHLPEALKRLCTATLSTTINNVSQPSSMATMTFDNLHRLPEEIKLLCVAEILQDIVGAAQSLSASEEQVALVVVLIKINSEFARLTEAVLMDVTRAANDVRQATQEVPTTGKTVLSSQNFQNTINALDTYHQGEGCLQAVASVLLSEIGFWAEGEYEKGREEDEVIVEYVDEDDEV